MKIQRHLTKWYRANGSEIYGSFERWGYKKAATVKAHDRRDRRVRRNGKRRLFCNCIQDTIIHLRNI